MDEWFYTCVDLVDGRLKITPFRPTMIFWMLGHRFGVRKAISFNTGRWVYVATEQQSGLKVGKESRLLRDVEDNVRKGLANFTAEKLGIMIGKAVQKHHRVMRAQQEIDALAEADAREAQEIGDLA